MHGDVKHTRKTKCVCVCGGGGGGEERNGQTERRKEGGRDCVDTDFNYLCTQYCQPCVLLAMKGL